MTPEQLIEALLKLLMDGTAMALTAAGVVILTNIVKFFLKGVPAVWIALVIQIVVWIVYHVLVANGLGAQFETYWAAFITIVSALASLFIGDMTNTAIYNAGLRAQSKLFGYQRDAPTYKKAVG